MHRGRGVVPTITSNVPVPTDGGGVLLDRPTTPTRKPSVLMANVPHSDRSSRIVPKYKYNDTTSPSWYSSRRQQPQQSSRRNYSKSIPTPTTTLPDSYMPPKQSNYYSGRATCAKNNVPNPSFDSDFGPFGNVVQQDTTKQHHPHQALNTCEEDINSMFRRPDYKPLCPEGRACHANFRGRGGNRHEEPPTGGNHYSNNNRNSMNEYAKQQNPPWDAEAMSVVQDKDDPPTAYMRGRLPPPHQQPVVLNSGSRQLVGGETSGRRNYNKAEDLDRILAKYGKGSRMNVNNAEQDPDFSVIRSDTFRVAAEKFCDPMINNGVDGFWNRRETDDIGKESARRRRSSRERDNLDHNEGGNSGRAGGGASLSRNPLFEQVPPLVDQNSSQDVVSETSTRVKSPVLAEFRRSTHVFPFKETASGHLVVEPGQIAFESRKISVLVADPNNNAAVFEFSTRSDAFTNSSKNEHILSEVKRAMSLSEANRSSSKMHHPHREIVQKRYSDSVEASDEFQKGMLQRVVSAKNADTHVMIGDKIFPCHGLALEAYSSYFERFHRPPECIQQIHLPESDVSPFVFPVIMDWIVQTNERRKEIITKENLVQLYSAAKHLAIKDLEHQCVNFLEKKVESSDPDLLSLWDEVKKRQNSCPELVRIIASKMAASYHDIYVTRRFLQMDVDELYMLLSSDDISIDSEMDVYDSAVGWLMHDWKNRKVHTNKIMSTVRFGLLSPLQLTQINLCPEINRVKSEKDYNQILTYGTVKSMIDEGLAYSILGESYKGQPEELKKWVDKSGVRAPDPRSSLLKKRGKIAETISKLEDASQTKLSPQYGKIPENSSSYAMLQEDGPARQRPGTAVLDSSAASPTHLQSDQEVRSRVSSNSTSSAHTAAVTSAMLAASGVSRTQHDSQSQKIFHEISKPKLLKHNSSHGLTNVGSSDELTGMDKSSIVSGSPSKRSNYVGSPPPADNKKPSK